MPSNKPKTASEADVLLAEVRGLRQVVDTRFDAVEREQDMTREWLGRVSATLDRVTEALRGQVGIETRLGGVEAEVSDLQLDVAGVEAELASLKESKTKTNLILNAVAGFIGAAATAVGMRVLHLGGS